MDTQLPSYYPTKQEVKSFVAQLVESPYFSLAGQHLFPELTLDQLRVLLSGIDTVDEFQYKFMFRFCQYVVNNTISSLSHSGTEQLTEGFHGIFVSNHRDIVLDAVLLQYLNISASRPTSHVVIGANLFEMPLMALLARLNKMVPIARGGGKVEFYRSLVALSSWIRNAIDRGDSVWIAQRNGRTKDGIDRTEVAMVKMLAMSGDRKDAARSLAGMNIIPMTLSYEWEPCAVLKARELTLRRQGPYTKAPGEDTNSIVTGVLSPKGRVHLSLGKPLSLDELQATGGDTARIAQLLDRHILSGYRLWPNNYIAADLLAGTDTHAAHYTPDQRAAFQAYLDQACADNPQPAFRDILLGIYANPTIACGNH